MTEEVVITGIGMVTSLGYSASDVLLNISRGIGSAEKPVFDASSFDCPYCISITDFNAEKYFPENKTLRLMNRDAQMAAVASHLAIKDASITVGETYQSEEVGLYGSTGMAGLAIADVTRLIRYSADENGGLDLKRFGQTTLKRVRPVLSFKLLANMPICFISILEGIRGENAVYTPWEGQGAQAIITGFYAIQSGRIPCVIVGGCDVRNHIFSFVNLQQLGTFSSWEKYGTGCVPGEGACFLILESQAMAQKRKARIYARIADYSIRSLSAKPDFSDCYDATLSKLKKYNHAAAIIASGDGEPQVCHAEKAALDRLGFDPHSMIYPKSHLGNLFAAAASVQVGLAADFINQQENHNPVLVNCFGFGSEQAAFILDTV